MLMDEGADILLPVAGNVGLGTAAVVKERGDAYIIGVDTDWVVFYPEYADIILTSIQKRLDVSVVSAVKSIADNTFTGARTLARWRTAVSAAHPSTIWMLSSLRQPKQIWSRPRLTSSPVRSRPSHKSVQQLD